MNREKELKRKRWEEGRRKESPLLAYPSSAGPET